MCACIARVDQYSPLSVANNPLLGPDPNMMAWPLARTMRTHYVLAHVETCLPQPFAERAIRARRPDCQHAAWAQRGASGLQTGGAV